jgi:hypothetical protein
MAANYSAVNPHKANLSYIYNYKQCVSSVRSPHGTTNNEMSSPSVGITCACQRQSFVGLARRDREKSERFTKTYTMRLRS